jgi:hypothetical protein
MCFINNEAILYCIFCKSVWIDLNFMYFYILKITEQDNVTCNMYFLNYSENVRMISRLPIMRASNNKMGSKHFCKYI